MRSRSLVVSAVFLTLFVAMGLTGAYAQYRGSLHGAVTDPQGAVVSNATLTLTDKETNRTLTAKTDEAGVYSIGGLPPSRYRLTVEATGFKKKILEDVSIVSEQANSLNVLLDVGTVTETVTVNGDSAPLLDAETATLAGTVTSQQIQALPSFGRDVFQLAQLAPGAFGDGSQAAGGGVNGLPGGNYGGSLPGSNTGVFPIENAVQISVGGGRREVNNFQIDGVGVTSASWGGTSVITPNADAVKEVQVVTNSYDAEDGRYSGGQVKITTQNGTNSYHGSVYWRAARPGLNAFQKYNGPGNSVLRNNAQLNDLGGSIGAPIIRNKLFGFFSYETILTNGGATNQGWFETSQFRAAAPAGSAAAAQLGYKGAGPLPGKLLEGANDQHTCTDIGLIDYAADPVNGNCHFIVGQGLDLGSPLSQVLFPFNSPLPHNDPSWQNNTQPGLGGDGTGNPATNLDGIPDLQFISQNYNNPTTERQYNGRLDYNATNKDLIAFSLFYVPVSNTGPNGSVRSMNTLLSEHVNKAATILWDRTFSPTLQNEFRGNAAGWRWNSLRDNPNAPFGFPVLNVQNLSFTSIGNISPSNFGVGSPLEFDQWTYAGKDVLTKVHNSHTLKMGGEITRLLLVDSAPWNGRPTYGFNNMWDLLNDAPVSEGAAFDAKTGVPTNFRRDLRSTLYGFFVQDSYKMKPNLTISAGLRWDYFGPLSEKYGHMAAVELGQGNNIITNLRVRTGGNIYQADKNNFGPQLGFAWNPHRFDQKLVVRGGFGLGYSALQLANSGGERNNPPFVSLANSLTNPANCGTSGQPPCQILYGLSSFPSKPTSFFGYAGNPAALTQFDPTTNLPLLGQNYPLISLTAFPNHWNSTRTYRYSLDLQYDLGRAWVATLGYQGTHTSDLPRLYNLVLYEYARLAAVNQGLLAFNPAVQTLNMYDAKGYSNFGALLAGVRHRFSNSFQFEAQYRFSKSLDTGSNNYAPAQSNGNCSCGADGPYMYDLAREYGPSDFDVKHNFKLFGTWSPTLFRGDRSSLEKILGGWNLSGILNLHSGFPWTPVDNNFNSSAIYQGSGNDLGGGAPLRPGYYLGGFSAGNFKTQNYPNGDLAQFPENNPSSGQPCFVAGPALSDILAGNAAPGAIPCAPGVGRNLFRGPGYFDIDATLSKSFGLPPMKVLGENSKLEIRANFYNLFNRVNLANIDNNVVDSHFGQATGALGSRTIDFQLRFNF